MRNLNFGSKLRLSVLSSLVFGSLLASGCNFREDKSPDDEEATDTAGENPDPNDPSTPKLSFSELQTTVFQPACISCHSSAGGNLGGINLETYSNVKSAIAKIEKTTLIEKRMPPTAPLKASDRTKLRTWIDQGAVENP